MRAVRIALVVLIPVIWVPVAIIAGCGTFRGCGNAWDTPPGSLRYQLYDALEQHRWLVGGLSIGYGVAVIAVFRREIVHAFSRLAVLRVVGLILVAIVVAASGVLLSRT